MEWKSSKTDASKINGVHIYGDNYNSDNIKTWWIEMFPDYHQDEKKFGISLVFHSDFTKVIEFMNMLEEFFKEKGIKFVEIRELVYR